MSPSLYSVVRDTRPVGEPLEMKVVEPSGPLSPHLMAPVPTDYPPAVLIPHELEVAPAVPAVTGHVIWVQSRLLQPAGEVPNPARVLPKPF